MEKMPKFLILDKSVFEATQKSKLCCFASKYNLIVCDILFTECLTSNRVRKYNLLKSLQSLIRAGANCGSSVMVLIREEVQKLRPFKSIIEQSLTNRIRSEPTRTEEFFSQREIDEAYNQNFSCAKTVPMVAKLIKENSLLQHPWLQSEMKKRKASNEEHFGAAVDWADTNVYDAKKILFSNWVKDLDNFCVSSEWISWHYLRRILILAHVYFWKDTGYGGAWGNRQLRKYYNDMEYVNFLCRADGLLTSDNDCAFLAKLMFPEKDVFSNLNEVPAEYLCHWTQ